MYYNVYVLFPKHTRRHRRHFPIQSPLLPSVKYKDTITGKELFSLSCVNIPIQWANPHTQQSHKNHRRIKQMHASAWKKILHILLAVITFSNHNCQVHALPNTNHALVNEPSRDAVRQRAYVKTIIQNATNNPHLMEHPNLGVSNITDNNKTKTDSPLPNTPHCFIADTDSQTYLLDTGANRFIVNNIKLLNQFNYAQASVKGINGTSVAIQGNGEHTIVLQSDDGHRDTINVKAVYVPSSPYNIISPQLLIHALKSQGYEVKPASHDDAHYSLSYSKNGSPLRKLTVKSNQNDLFLLRTAEGYKRFSKYACCYGEEWCAFASHVIPDEEDSVEDGSDTNGLQRVQTDEQTRELDKAQTHGISRESPHTIPYEETDFESIRQQPSNVNFEGVVQSTNEDPSIAIT